MAQSGKPSSKRSAAGQAGARRPHERARDRSVQPVARRTGVRDWVAGARVRTLPLAVAPVAIGTGIGIFEGGLLPWRPGNAVLALVVALALQIGVNFANDYSDGVRGTDAFRVGPKRLTGSGSVPPKRVLAAAFVCFAIAAIAGATLVLLTAQWWLFAVGALAIAAAWFYTGGRRPYGYAGLGEIAVFVFFGLVATVGSALVQSDVLWSQTAFLAGSAVGLFACAVLMVNNLRDRDQDVLAGKRTLSVRIGARWSRAFFALGMLAPFVAVGAFWAVVPAAGLALFVLLAAVPAVVIVLWAQTPRELILALQLSSVTALMYGLVIGAAFALAGHA